MIRTVLRPEEERGFLRRVASAPTGGGLLRAAVLLARTGCPGADPDRVESILEGLASEVRTRAAGATTAGARARALSAVLAGRRGPPGEKPILDDPRDSCPECVLDRGRGLPIAQSLVWMETARRAGWRTEGIGLPGHFVMRLHGDLGEEGGTPLLLDPFHGGGVLSRADLKQLLRDLHGRPVRLPVSRLADLKATDPRDLLLRMLRNLRGSFRRRGELDKALAVAEDMLLLSPGLAEAFRDRGLLRVESGEREAGVVDLRAYLDRTTWSGTGADGGPETVLRLVKVLTDDAELMN